MLAIESQDLIATSKGAGTTSPLKGVGDRLKCRGYFGSVRPSIQLCPERGKSSTQTPDGLPNIHKRPNCGQWPRKSGNRLLAIIVAPGGAAGTPVPSKCRGKKTKFRG